MRGINAFTRCRCDEMARIFRSSFFRRIQQPKKVWRVNRFGDGDPEMHGGPHHLESVSKIDGVGISSSEYC